MTLNIPANDHGAIYVLEYSGPMPAGLEAKTDAAMMAILGPVVVNTDYVDAITPGMLTEMTLPDLIRHGYDMPVTDAEADELRGLFGTVVLVMSAAFGGQARDIDLPADVRHVATLREPAHMSVPQPLTSQSAKGIIGDPHAKGPRSDARIGGLVATVALIFMFVLVALMIWVA